jgi:hypothetical protein
MPVAVPHRHRWARVALERPEQETDEQGHRWQETCKRCLTCSAESRGRVYPDLLAHVFSIPAREPWLRRLAARGSTRPAGLRDRTLPCPTCKRPALVSPDEARRGLSCVECAGEQ